MKLFISTVGILLILAGLASFAYQSYTYTEREKVAQIGGLQVTADTEKTIHFPPILGGGAIAAGIILVIVGRVGKK